MKNSEKIIGARVYLRKLDLADASPAYCGWLNDEAVNKYMRVKNWTMAELKDYVALRINRPDCFFEGIFDKKNDLHIGTVKLEPIDWSKREAKFGLMIGDKNYWGQGIGTEATKLMVNYAFDKMGLSRIKLTVHLENKPAVRIYEKVGFKVDEIKRRGHRLSEVLMSISQNG